MRKVFVKNLIFIQVLNLIIKPVWLLLIDRMAQNILGVAYDEHYLVLNLTLLLNIFLDLGIQNFNNTSIAADNDFFKRNFKGILILKSILASFYIFLVAGIGLNSGMPSTLLFILIGNQVLTTFLLYLRTNINGLHDYTTDSLLSVSDKFFAILICILFYITGNISIIHFVAAQGIASCISFSIALLINIKHWKLLPPSPSDIGKDSLKTLIRMSLPYALLFTLMNFYTRIDVTMMKWLLPDAVFHAGIYAHSFRLLDAAAMFAMLFAGLLLPMFAKMIREKNDLRPLANLASVILLIISITVALAAHLYSEDIMKSLYVFENEEEILISASVFRNIMLTFIPMSLTFVFSTLLTAKKDIWYMNIFALTAFVCNCTINLFLIPEYKSFGASIGSLITQSVFALLCIKRCFTLFNFKLPFGLILRFIVLCFLLIGLYFLIKGIEILYLELFLFATGSLIFSFLLNLIEFNKIGRFFDKTRQ